MQKCVSLRCLIWGRGHLSFSFLCLFTARVRSCCYFREELYLQSIWL